MKKFNVKHYQIKTEENMEIQEVIEETVEADNFYLKDDMVVFTDSGINKDKNIAAFSRVISVLEDK
jgi:hypothetical protein